MKIIEAFCCCNVGRIRRNNEDNFYFDGKFLPQTNNGAVGILSAKVADSDSPLFCVFDGMGGEAAGEVASYVSAFSTDKYIKKIKIQNEREFLDKLCHYLNDKVYRESAKYALGRMGSTIASILFRRNNIFICNVGDSRVYSFKNKKLSRLSVDDIELLPAGSKHKPRLIQNLGLDPTEILIEPNISSREISKGEQFIICSDGLTDMLTEDEIAHILETHISGKAAVKKLVDVALENGGKDNITVILCKVK